MVTILKMKPGLCFEMIEAKIVFWLKKKYIYIYIYIYCIYYIYIYIYLVGIICMGGDFNIAPGNVLDRMPPKNLHVTCY